MTPPGKKKPRTTEIEESMEAIKKAFNEADRLADKDFYQEAGDYFGKAWEIEKSADVTLSVSGLYDYLSAPYHGQIRHTLRLKDFVQEEKSEHERTREYISEKIETLSTEVAKKDDLLRAKEEIINKVERESKEIQLSLEQKIQGLQTNLSRFLPYKRAFRASSYVLIFFLASVFSDILLGITIVQQFWAWLGLSISAAFLLMSYFAFLDWQKSTRQ